MQTLILQPEWDCSTCTSTQKATRGCHDTPTSPLIFEGAPLARCPRRPLLDEPDDYDEVFWLYSNYVRGVLPYGSELYSHPHKLVQFFRLIDAAKGAASAEKERQERKREAMRQSFSAAQSGR